MLQLYEDKLTENLNNVIYGIQTTVWGEEQKAFLMEEKQISYPSLLIQRIAKEFPLTKSVDIETESGTAKLFQLDLDFVGRIFIKKHKTQNISMKDVRFFFEENPYVEVLHNGEIVPIGMRFLYIRLNTVRDSMDDKGPMRVIEFSWKSYVPIFKETEWESLLSSVKIYFGPTNMKSVTT